MGNLYKRKSIPLGPIPRITVTDVDNPTPNGAEALGADVFDPEDPSRPSAIGQSNSARERSEMAVPNDCPPVKFPVKRVIMDFALLAVVGFGVEILLRSIRPYERGFFCDDESIRLPYKPSTVSATALFAYAFGITAVAIILTEYYHLYFDLAAESEIYSEYELGRNLAERLAIRFVRFYGYALLALVTTNIFTGIAKYMVGRLRPHFLHVCRPNVNLTDCAPYSHSYITDYVCTTHDPQMVARLGDARLSFFSGHSSLSMCASTFTVIYLQSRLGHDQLGSRMLVPLLQVGILCAGMFISYSRIFDHMHHSNDVLAGMLLGSWVAAITLLIGAGLVPRRGSGQKSKRAPGAHHHQCTSPTARNEISSVAYDSSVNTAVITTTAS